MDGVAGNFLEGPAHKRQRCFLKISDQLHLSAREAVMLMNHISSESDDPAELSRRTGYLLNLLRI
jgi:hypothetical protein